MGVLNDENKKLNGMLSDGNGKSMIGASTVKTYSMILD